MKKTAVDVFDCAGDILKGLSKGAIVLSASDGRVNAMTISWGTLGREWEKKIFTIFIRETRFTHELLDRNPEFTVCIPRKGFERRLIGLFGTRRGRDGDKIRTAGVELLESEKVAVPAIKAPSIVLECRVIWKRDQKIGEDETAYKIYTTDANGVYVGPNHDTIYCGEIVNACRLEE